MKKFLLVFMAMSSIFLFGCNPSGVGKIGDEIKIEKPIETKILKKGSYSLDCKTKYYTTSNIGGEIIKESFIRTSEGNERNTLYIEGINAKFFGADYQVIQDDNDSLIIMRNYNVSGLTEVVSINKNSGIGFDVKTLASGLSGAPTSDTYILSCTEI